MDFVFSWITHYGYSALALLLMLGIAGLPIPDETLLVFCGYLVFKGELAFPWVLLSGFLGSVCGISLSYTLGRFFAKRVLDRWGRYIGLTEARLLLVDRWFGRLGPWLLSCGYFIIGVRHFTALVAGMSGLSFRTFAFFAYLGAAVWVTFFVSLGYFVGERWQHTSAEVHHYAFLALGIAAAAALVVWLVLRFRRPRR
jgi:membrane protein DedA with SNARE-associated domain